MSDILFEKRGKAGFVTLNRPKALNALTHGMVTALADQLTRWAGDPEIAHVVITGEGGKAFCAGGDIVGIYESKMAGQMDGLGTFFKDEYLLNAQIKAYPKPYIALIDGIVMGGGVGVSVHGSHRVGTEKTMFAMPETGIGFFPDVGGTYFLPRMPKKTGVYCALSAGRLKQGDALASGVLTHTVKEADLAAIEEALASADDADAALKPFLVDVEPGTLMQQADLIEACFSENSVAAILERLDGSSEDFATKAAETIRQKSPTSVMIAFEQMQRGANSSFNDCMKLEYRIVSQVLKGEDFFEGVRALLVDKDQSPKWSPSELAHVDIDDLASYFREPADGDLPL
ncbi:enoyl-CoA hydratase/isomerase family protein [Labrenzia sp. PHM005]|uniref:enoyl-CoA hydratase/isomerase family protein n=1 Tax=Labrenzia sp. PHM005 TaxID=2590016 RepID=UPI00114081D1|nr:enoyl-CoA hydratase/isomerase family protein [Labrenzia sp. PHM005]QDG78214.1 enoyl-CoA hydratase/isomerase family protein [Labrenzia sp. PHM005]